MNQSSNPTFGLGIPGLPPLFDAMVAGGLYAVQCSSPPARAALVAHCVAQGLEAGAVAVITGSSPSRLVEQSAETCKKDVRHALETGLLKVFRLKESSAKNVFRHGPLRLTQEIDHFSVPPEALVILDGADDIFTLQDPYVVAEQVRVYQNWIRKRNGCCVMVFTLLSSGAQFASAYRSLLDHLDGASQIESGRSHLSWVVDFWASPFGMVASRTLDAQIEPNGSLSVSVQAEPETLLESTKTEINPRSTDEDVIFCMDSTLAGVASQGSSGKWTFCDSLVGVMHSARNAKGATVILVYDQATELRQLAQAAHTLRVNLGKRLHIVVREQNASLRYQNELLMLRLGVNMVIHRNVPVSQLLLALESLQGQIFERNIDVDFETALASITPSEASGYQVPQAFHSEVKGIVERSKSIGVPFAMVRINLPPDINPRNAVGQFKMTRGGDLMTATDAYLLLFISGCPQSSLLQTLNRMGGDTVQDTFPAMDFALSEIEITDLLGQLERNPQWPHGALA